MEYAYLAKIYDHLMKEVDYQKWTTYIESFMNKSPSVENVRTLELACGTGNITIPLGEKGYYLTAVDRSAEMLSQAQQKSIARDLPIDFYQQDILNLTLQREYDNILCLCDGVNYVLDVDDLDELFRKVYSLLKRNGVFIFDISSYYKLKEILGDNTFGEDLGEITYLWENYFSAEEESIEMDLTFFELNKNGYYEKHKEYHIQKAHKKDTLKRLLLNKGFNQVSIYHDLSLDPPKNDSERIFFVCRKS